MNLFFRLYDKEILRIFIYIILFLWGISVSLALVLKKDHLVVVKVDEYGTTVLTGNSSQSVTIETENFINNFIQIFYNYNSENFDDHIDKSFAFLDREQALKMVDKLNALSEKMKVATVHQQAFAQKLIKIKEGYFEVELKVTRATGMQEATDTYKVLFELNRTRRSIENPYGLLISSLEEIYD